MGSVEFWCRLAGVRGLDIEDVDSSDVSEEMESGVDSGEGSRVAIIKVYFARRGGCMR